MPCALHTRCHAPAGPRRGCPVGSGDSACPSLEVRTARLVDMRVPHLVADLDPLTHLHDERLDAARSAVPVEELDLLHASSTRRRTPAARARPGLTPLGDDVLTS